jgi:hypothetical protein
MSRESEWIQEERALRMGEEDREDRRRKDASITRTVVAEVSPPPTARSS